jgi:hypothetical protein
MRDEIDIWHSGRIRRWSPTSCEDSASLDPRSSSGTVELPGADHLLSGSDVEVHLLPSSRRCGPRGSWWRETELTQDRLAVF